MSARYGEDAWCLVLAGLAIATGIVVRIAALDAAALAEDEYYLITSVHYILDHGLPLFPQGGYYVRGLIQQYLTAPILLLTGSSEWSVRIVPVLASVAAIPAVILIGRRLGGPVVAALAVTLFSLSIWEVEFARFGRMYAPFQTLFLWQCYLLLRVTLDGRIRLWKWMLYLSLLGLFVYEGAIFLWVVAAIPLLSGHVRPAPRTLIAAGSVLGALVAWQMIDFRRFGQPPALPAEILLDLQAGVASSALPVRLPAIVVGALFDRPVMAIGIIGIMLVSGWLIVRDWRANRSLLTAALAFLLLILAALGLVGLAVLLVLLSWLIRPEVIASANRTTMRWALVLGFSVATLAWALALSGSGLSAYGVAKQLLNYPPISQAVVQQWLDTMPRMTMLFVLLMAGRVVIELRAEARSEAWRIVAATALVAIVMTAVLRTGQMSSRYTFFVYATILLLTAEALWVLAGILSRQARPRAAVALIGLASVLVISDDFSLTHLARIHTPAIAYRIDRPVPVWQHLVPRDDFRTPALFVNERIREGDIVISGPPAVPHYLNRLDYSYELYPGIRFFDVVAVEGTRELWTDSRLLWSEVALFETLCHTEQDAWLVLHADPRGIRSARDARVRSVLDPWSVFTNFGETVQVYRVPGAEWRAERACESHRVEATLQARGP